MMNDDASFRAMHPSSLFCVVKKKVSPLAHDFTKSTFLIGSHSKKNNRQTTKKEKKRARTPKETADKIFYISEREREREREDEDEEEDKR